VIDVGGPLTLRDRSLLVVGGMSGIGWAAVELGLRLGARVTVADVDVGGERLAALGELGAGVRPVACDATDPAAMEAAVEAAIAHGGWLDGLLTTVGGAHVAPIEELDLPAWRAEIDFNLTSAYVACRAVLPHMRARRRGAIVTTSSGYAVLPAPDRAGYAAAKAGVIALTRALAAACASHGVRVNCLAPGPTDTPRFRAMNGGDEGVERVRRQMPMGAIPQPSELASVALFLLSDAASQVTGQVVHVNGGLIMP
jgi:NAD(P)-dependent dehydrogenase (short-subunit alcohol dehydrogenase family)